MLNVGIIGVSGYSGLVALERLLEHPQVCVTYVSANNTQGPIGDIWPHLKGKTDLICQKFNFEEAIKHCDLFFLAVPHKTAMEIAPKLLTAKKRVIDISADYRLDDPALYKEWYGVDHTDERNLKQAVYGLPELHRENIKKADLLANPGCYSTAAILALAPIVSACTDQIQSITIDAKSGVSGAGRKKAEELMNDEMKDNFKAYKVLSHQHTPEINQYLSRLANKPVSVTFTPHLLPLQDGILETIYVHLDQPTTDKEIHDLYKKFYKTEEFVRILNIGEQPDLKSVTGTNFCDVSIAAKDNVVVIVVVIDNLMKGASGQAVQNMNIMYNFKESEGLK